MKYLIDPNYANLIPFNFMLKTLTITKRLENVDKNANGRLRKKSFKPHNPKGFDGMDLNLAVASLFTKDWNIKRTKLKKLKAKKWSIYTFHAGQEKQAPQFKHTYTNLAEDDVLTKKKIKTQISVASELQKASDIGKKPIIVFHPGMIPKKAKVPRSVLNNLEFAVRKAEDHKIILALETMHFPFGGHLPYEKHIPYKKGYYIGADYNDLMYILDKIRSPWLKICLDWGHVNAYAPEYAKDKKNPKRYLKEFSYHSEVIDALNKDICYAHIHYNNSHNRFPKKLGKDEHLPLTRIYGENIYYFKKSIEELINKTSILEHDFIHLELMPFTFYPKGSKLKEQLESIEILKSIIN